MTSEAVVDALTQADRDKRAAEEELRNIHALPVVILHLTVAVDYRAKVAELEHAVKQDDASRLEAIPILRALIERIVFTPADAGRQKETPPEEITMAVERVKGIEPSYSAWEAAALPLSYTRLTP